MRHICQIPASGRLPGSVRRVSGDITSFHMPRWPIVCGERDFVCLSLSCPRGLPPSSRFHAGSGTREGGFSGGTSRTGGGHEGRRLPLGDADGLASWGTGDNLIRHDLRSCHLPLKGKAWGRRTDGIAYGKGFACPDLCTIRAGDAGMADLRGGLATGAKLQFRRGGGSTHGVLGHGE